MIVTPLIIWFLAPLFIGGALGFISGYILSKLVEYNIRIKHLDKTPLNDLIRKNFNDPTKHNKISMKNFLVKEDEQVYTGKIDNKGNLSNVASIEYESIDYSLNKQLNELPDDKVLLI